MKLEEGRKQIDDLDTMIVALLNRRAILARRIGEIKMRAGIPILDPEREGIVLRRIVHASDGEIGDQALALIYREILAESRRIQERVVAEASTRGELSK